MAGVVEDVLVDGVVVGEAFEEGGAGCDGAGVGRFVEGAEVVYCGGPGGGGVEEGRIDVEAVFAWWVSAIRVGHVGCSDVVVYQSRMSNSSSLEAWSVYFTNQISYSNVLSRAVCLIGNFARLVLRCQGSRA